MNFERWVRAHRRSILFTVGVLTVAGLASAFQTPVALFPHIQFPRVVASLEAGDRPAEEMMALVTAPIEQVLRAVPAARSVRSVTSRGSAEISVTFDWGTDMTIATLQVDAALAKTLPELPPGARADAKRMDPTVFPVIAYSLVSSLRSDADLYNLAFYGIRPLLARISGVARVAVLGGAPEEIQVFVDPSQLERFGLSIDDVANSLRAANVVVAAGPLEDRYKQYLVLTDSRYRTIDEIGETTVRTGAEGFVRVADVASVVRSSVPSRTRVTADGRTAVLFQVYQQPGANTVQIARDVRNALSGAGNLVPGDVHLSSWYDQSDLITASVSSVRDSVLIGIVLAALVLLAFLRDLRITLIAVIVVPAVLAATMLMISVSGMGFNLMTLGGMAAAVGLVIDDAIVVVEHIVRRISEAKTRGAEARLDRALAAAREFSTPLVGSSLSTIVIFVPLAFLGGVTGAFFKALSLTMASALIISFLVAWLAVPVLAGWLLQRGESTVVEGRLTIRLHSWYERLIGRLMRRPVLVLLGLGPLLLLGYAGYRRTGSGFMPASDEGGFILDYRAPAGTSLTETDRLLRQAEDVLRTTPEVQTYSRRTGLQLGGGITEANEGDFFVRLIPPPRRPIDAVIDDVRRRIETTVPGLSVEMAQLMEDLIGDLTAVPQPIEVKVFSESAAVLDSLGPLVASIIDSIPGVVDVRDGVKFAGDALIVRIDRERAALEGVNPDAVARRLLGFIGGTVTTTIQSGERVVGVRVWIPRTARGRIDDVGKLMLSAPDGHRFRASRIASVETVSGQPQITRDDLKRMVAVTGRISGRDLGSTIRDVTARLNRPGVIPNGVSYELGGTYEQQRIAFKGLLSVFVAALVLVFLLLLVMYERFLVAGAMLLTTMLAIPAVMFGLWVTHTELNIASMMGLTMVVGIVTEVSIFYFSELRELGVDSKGSLQYLAAGKNRARPIAMTTVAAMLALLPLALGIGQGSGMLQPLAISIIAGLFAQMPLVLVALPVFFSVLHRPRGRVEGPHEEIESPA
ncbi:MAG: efflux RND transporter permease subunit [Gemmatimonadota bacterium]